MTRFSGRICIRILFLNGAGVGGATEKELIAKRLKKKVLFITSSVAIVVNLTLDDLLFPRRLIGKSGKRGFLLFGMRPTAVLLLRLHVDDVDPARQLLLQLGELREAGRLPHGLIGVERRFTFAAGVGPSVHAPFPPVLRQDILRGQPPLPLLLLQGLLLQLVHHSVIELVQTRSVEVVSLPRLRGGPSLSAADTRLAVLLARVDVRLLVGVSGGVVQVVLTAAEVLDRQLGLLRVDGVPPGPRPANGSLLEPRRNARRRQLVQLLRRPVEAAPPTQPPLAQLLLFALHVVPLFGGAPRGHEEVVGRLRLRRARRRLIAHHVAQGGVPFRALHHEIALLPIAHGAANCKPSIRLTVNGRW